MRFHHRPAGEILRRNQLDVVALARVLVFQRLEDIGIGFGKAGLADGNGLGRRGIRWDVHKGNGADGTLTGVGGVDPGIEDFLQAFAADFLRSNAKYIGIMLLATQARHFNVVHQRGADAGNLVGGHAQTEAGAIDDHARIGLAQGNGAGHARGNFFRAAAAEVLVRITVLAEPGTDLFLQFRALGIGGKGDLLQRGHPRLVVGRAEHEIEQAGHRGANLVAAFAIDLARLPDGIGKLPLHDRQVGLKLAQEEGLLRSGGKKQEHRIEMPVGHDKNEIGPAHEIGHQRLAADVADVEAELRHDFDRIGAGRLTADRADACRSDFNVPPAPHQIGKKSLRHGAATNIAGTNK